MRQTKYALAVPKNLGVGVDFRPFSKGDFLSRRLYSVFPSIAKAKWGLGLYEVASG